MQGAANRHRRDGGHIAAIFIHDIELQGGVGVSLGWLEAVAVAGECDASTRQRHRSEIEDSVAKPIELRRRVQRIGFVPVAGPGVGRELAVGQALHHTGVQVDAVDVRTLVGQVTLGVDGLWAQIRKVAVVDPLRVERQDRIGHAAIAAGNQDFFTAVGMQQHEIRAGIEHRRMENFRPIGVLVVAESRLAHVDDVIRQRAGQGQFRKQDANRQHEALQEGVHGPLLPGEPTNAGSLTRAGAPWHGFRSTGLQTCARLHTSRTLACGRQAIRLIWIGSQQRVQPDPVSACFSVPVS